MKNLVQDVESSFLSRYDGNGFVMDSKYNDRVFAVSALSFGGLMRELGLSNELEVRRFVDI